MHEKIIENHLNYLQKLMIFFRFVVKTAFDRKRQRIKRWVIVSRSGAFCSFASRCWSSGCDSLPPSHAPSFHCLFPRALDANSSLRLPSLALYSKAGPTAHEREQQPVLSCRGFCSLSCAGFRSVLLRSIAPSLPVI